MGHPVNRSCWPALDAAGAERRRERRYPLRLRCAIIYHRHPDSEAQPTYYGTTWDISLSGMSFIVGSNVFTEDEIKVLLALPSRKPGGRPRIVECTAVMRHTVFSGEVGDFRIGITFKVFKGNGARILRDALAAQSRISSVTDAA